MKPPTSHSPACSVSRESLKAHKENQTPPGTPTPDSPRSLLAVRTNARNGNPHGNDWLIVRGSNAAGSNGARGNYPSGKSASNPTKRQRTYTWNQNRNPTLANPQTRKPFQALGGATNLSTSEQVQYKEGMISDTRYPDLILQPDSSPISKDKLTAEVEEIYAGLVRVEAKCINIDAAQAAKPNVRLEVDQWRDLIALHRTLLYEHHDFLMATQHPCATPELRALVDKHGMRSRMWKHGIHTFLDILRSGRPDSHDYMLAFIHIAYQMLALLFETVPTFRDTWIECLGDIARYGITIEEDREQRAIWAGVASRWYNSASDRRPGTGRLYHHLGIVEMPSVRKYFLYTKSLTCVEPFPHAKDSLATFCTSVLRDQCNYHANDNSAEAGLVVSLAESFIGGSTTAKMEAVNSEALSRLARDPTGKIREFGVELVISIVGAILESGSSQNWLWQRFSKVVSEDIKGCRPSANAPGLSLATRNEAEAQPLSLSTTQAPSFIMEFSYSAFGTLILLGQDRQSVQDLLSTVHIILAWFYGLHSLQSRTQNDAERDKVGLLMNPEAFSWERLSQFLNLTTTHQPISARTVEFAKQGSFLTPETSEDARPLPEDYTIRQLIWAPQYYPSDWFSEQLDDGSRAIEDLRTHEDRVERVKWLAVLIALRIPHLQVDLDNRTFYAPSATSIGASMMVQDENDMGDGYPITDLASISSRSSSTPSARSTDDGYQFIETSKKRLKSWAEVAARRPKQKQDHRAVQTINEEGPTMRRTNYPIVSASEGMYKSDDSRMTMQQSGRKHVLIVYDIPNEEGNALEHNSLRREGPRYVPW